MKKPTQKILFIFSVLAPHLAFAQSGDAQLDRELNGFGSSTCEGASERAKDRLLARNDLNLRGLDEVLESLRDRMQQSPRRCYPEAQRIRFEAMTYRELRRGKNAASASRADPVVLRRGAPWVEAASSDFRFPDSLRSGDVIISKGAEPIHSLIALMGPSRTSFSHASLIYRPRGSDQIYVLESHIDTGVTITPLDPAKYDAIAFMRHYRGRILRMRDRAMAEAVAEDAYQLFSTREAAGNRMLYDLTMNVDSDAQATCVEVLTIPLSRVSRARGRGDGDLPFRSVIASHNNPFLAAMNAQVSSTYKPGDLEWDERFSTVASWTDFDRSAKAIAADLAARKQLQWLEMGDYYHHTVGINSQASLLAIKKLFANYPPGTRRILAKTFLSFEATSDFLIKALDEQEPIREYRSLPQRARLLDSLRGEAATTHRGLWKRMRSKP